MILEERIVDIAQSFIGQEELPNNSGFKDPWFEEAMKSVGWEMDQSWCAYFPKYVWTEAYADDEETLDLIDKYFVGHAVASFYNFRKSEEFAVRQVPVIGAIAVWKHGFTMNGHMGIVTSFTTVDFETVEGNTHNEGELEAKEVADRFRMLNMPHAEDAMNLLGFIYTTRLK